MRHWTIAAAAVLFLGQTATGDLLPDKADLFYDPGTGDVKMDQSEAAGGLITQFTLKNAEGGDDFVAPGKAAFPFLSLDTVDTVTELSQTDMLSFGFNPGPTWDLGEVFPTGKSLGQLTTFLTEATYNNGQDFDLIVIPEPLTTVSLLVGGAVLAGVRRRRRRAA